MPATARRLAAPVPAPDPVLLSPRSAPCPTARRVAAVTLVDPVDHFQIWDLDNTVVRCSEYYSAARAAFFAFIAAAFEGVTPEQAQARFNAIDMANIAGPLRFSRERFPRSMRETYQAFCRDRGARPAPSLEAQAYAIGDQVFSAPYDPYPGVVATLGAYRDAGVPMALCTKGEDDVQWGKILRHGLDAFFRHIRVVETKGPADIAGCARWVRRHARQAGLMIGDSRRDDIASGNAAGLVTVWVPNPAHAEYEKGYEHVVPTATVPWAAELPALVPALPAAPVR